jgi:hypothetical protein
LWSIELKNGSFCAIPFKPQKHGALTMLLAAQIKEDGHTSSAGDRIEKRRHERIQIMRAEDAILTENGFTKWVQIMDVSKGGLAFCYVATSRLMNGSFELEILSDRDGLCLENLKIEVVSDLQIGHELFLGFIPIRRCGAKFMELTTYQTHELESFLKNSGLNDYSQRALPSLFDEGAFAEGWCGNALQ